MFSNKTSDNQQGFASIIIVLTLVIITGLMAIAFGRLMRSEQRSALDRQLSTQAFYAAEAGVHDAEYALQKGYRGSDTTCNTSLSAAPYNITGGSVGSTGVGYTCLMIDARPWTLEYGDIEPTTSKYITFEGQDTGGTQQPIAALEFSWEGVDGLANYADSGSQSFPAQANWKNGAGTGISPGVVRVSITPIANNLDQKSLIDNTFTAYLYPSSDGSHAGFRAIGQSSGSSSWGNQGPIVNDACYSTPTDARAKKQCNVLITGLNATRYLVRIRTIYAGSHVVITAYSNNAASSPLRMAGAQATVDSTGKAQDVLRRIQVHVPEQAQFDLPEAALEAASSICKQLEVAPSVGAQELCT